MSHEDRFLVRRMLGGDERAFDEFYAGHAPSLYRFALTRLNRDHDAAEEVTQATLCRAIGKLGSYRGEAALLTWLVTFCRHEISAFCKQNARLPLAVDLHEDSPEVAAALESLGPAFEPPDQAYERAELSRRVHVALDRLPGNYGHALSWKYLDGLSVREIADLLELSPKAAESLLTRARLAFREAFTVLTSKPASGPHGPHGPRAVESS